MQLLDHRVVFLFLTFWGISLLFSTVAVPVCIPKNSARGFPFLHIPPTPVVSCVADFSHSDRCEVIFHCSFDSHFPDDQWCWASFHVSVGHLYVFSERVSIHLFCPFLIGLFAFWVLSFISTLYIMDISPVSDMSFANFCPSGGCLLVLLIVSFTVQRLSFWGCWVLQVLYIFWIITLYLIGHLQISSLP